MKLENTIPMEQTEEEVKQSMNAPANGGTFVF
jgi:hypothetical protein